MTTTWAGNDVTATRPAAPAPTATRRLRARFAGVAACVGALALSAHPATAQEAEEPSVWDGVYSAEQAMRGKKLYEGDLLPVPWGRSVRRQRAAAGRRELHPRLGRPEAGRPSSPARGRCRRAHRAPSARPATWTSSPYVLEVNEFPHGEGELTAERAGDILVYGADGPDAVPNFAMVQVVGCLARDDSTWIVTDGSEPIRTRDPDASSGDVLALTQAMALGGNTFELMYVFPDPDPYEGHRVEAKGFLIRREDGADALDAINVTAVASLEAACRVQEPAP